MKQQETIARKIKDAISSIKEDRVFIVIWLSWETF
jgi:hypothetical protein